MVLITTNNGSKAFSAGGDIKDIYYKKYDKNTNPIELTTFFKEEYELDYLIA